jgi:hypothetical protein
MAVSDAQLAAANAEVSSFVPQLFDLPVMPVAGILEPDAEVDIG